MKTNVKLIDVGSSKAVIVPAFWRKDKKDIKGEMELSNEKIVITLYGKTEFKEEKK